MTHRLTHTGAWLAGLLLSVVAASCATPAAPAASTPTPLTRVLGQFDAIEGTDYLVAPIRAKTGDSYSIFDLGARSGSWGLVYNLVFLDRRTETFQLLLPAHDYVIATAQPLSWPEDAEAESTPLGWLYSIIKEDTNGDGDLTREDSITVAVSEVGGTAYTEALLDVDEVYGSTLQDKATLLVIYRSAGHKYLAALDLPSHSVTATTELPALGPEVE